MPIIGIAYVALGVSIGVLSRGETTMLFVLLLEAATPTAMNLQLLCEVLGCGTAGMGRVLAVSYVLSILTVTLWCAAFISLVKGL